MWKPYNKETAHDILYNCNSPVSKKTFSFINRMICISGGKIWSECYGKDAIYFAMVGKNHVRLIEIAVRQQHQGTGLGKKVLYRLLKRMRSAGIYKLTFRTPINEDAYKFWLHIGAQIIDVKDEDYVMELTIKK